jgi:hypothetical protein
MHLGFIKSKYLIALHCHETKYQTDDADRETNTPQIM